jgi:stage V sporulation protein G
VDITEVRIKLMEEPGDRLKAFCSITFDDCCVVRDLKIIEGTNGPFVAMPSRKLTSHCRKCHMKNHLRAAYCNQCGSRLEDGRAPKDAEGRAKLYADIAHPINSDCRERIQDSVIREYFDEIERAKQPGYICRYDDFDLEYSDSPRARPARFDQPHGQPAPHQFAAGANSSVAANDRSAPQNSGPPASLPRSSDPESNQGGSFGAGIFPDS